MKEKNRKKVNRVVEVVLFFLILLIFIGILDFCSYWPKTAGYVNKLTVTSGSRYGTDEVEPILEEIKKDDGTTKLILGDSVANQLFDGLIGVNDNYCICPINRAITVAGQYILIKEYLKSHPDATDVYMVFFPGTLASTVDSNLAYQYVAIPFIENGNIDDLDELMMGKLEDAYGAFFLKPEIIRYIDYSGVNRKLYLNYLSKKNLEDAEEDYISDVSISYLEKIYDLCRKNDVNIYLMSTPMPDIEKRHKQQEEITKVFEETGLMEMYPNYCNGYIFYPEEYFLDDQVHFKPEYKNREIMNPMIKEMILKDSCLSDLENIFEDD